MNVMSSKLHDTDAIAAGTRADNQTMMQVLYAEPKCMKSQQQ